MNLRRTWWIVLTSTCVLQAVAALLQKSRIRLEDTLETILTLETAGDPMGRRPKAKRSSLRRLSSVLKQIGHPASRPTLAKLLRKLDYSPKANARRVEARGATPVQRNEQFQHIGQQREEFAATGDPIISVDTKKKN